MTERRDFLAPSGLHWGEAYEKALPAPRVYRPSSFGRTLHDVADKLFLQFCESLPALAHERKTF